MTERRQGPPRLSLLVWVFCALIGVALIGVWDGERRDADQGDSTTTHQGTEQAPLTPQPTQPTGARGRDHAVVPVRLDIATIDVSTPVVRLGLLPDRTVQVPADPDRAGWFQRGPEPGRMGSSVILGHVDSQQGPAVFARLDELDPGDEVTIGRADGSEVEFVVRETVTYLNADFPAQRVYAAQGARRLNLVTCAGAYDVDRGGYQSNLVVYTRRAAGAHTG